MLRSTICYLFGIVLVFYGGRDLFSSESIYKFRVLQDRDPVTLKGQDNQIESLLIVVGGCLSVAVGFFLGKKGRNTYDLN